MLTVNNQTQQVQDSSLVTKLLIACGAVGPILFVLTFLVEGAILPGYSQWRDFVSELGAGNAGWMQDINFLFCGLCLICFAVGLRQVFRSGRGSIAGPLFLGLFGVSLMIAGIFPSDGGLGYYPPGASSTVHTLHGIIHAANAIPAFSTLTIAILILALRFTKDPAWRGWGLYSVISALLVLGFFIACVYVSGLDQKGVLPNSPTGFFERITIIIGWTWLALVAIKLLRQMRSPASSAIFSGEVPDVQVPTEQPQASVR